MIEQVQALLRDNQIADVTIIDDAYDDVPKAAEIKTENWNLFLDEMDEESIPLITELLSVDVYDENLVKNCRADDDFVARLWGQKERLSARVKKALFEDYNNEQQGKIAQLQPLETIFRERLGVHVHCLGRSGDYTQVQTRIVFIDLFLGITGEEEAIDRAIRTIREIRSVDPNNPPVVILMSSSPRLASKRDVFRDDGQLLGCQFRSIEKNVFSDTNTFLTDVHDLISSFPDSLKLNRFILAWERALDTQRETFLRSVRKLDLTDYADLKRLILDAEGEGLGDHLVDVYHTYFHHFLESDRDLLDAGHSLNTLEFKTYPPSHFLPTDEIKPILDASIFENAERVKFERDVAVLPHLDSIQLGDVFISREAIPYENREVLVVLTQACDLQHGNAKSILLIKGSLKPYSIQNYRIPNAPRTPIIDIDGAFFVIDWDESWPITWSIDSLDELLGLDGKYQKIRRFRSLYGLQLQQRFIGNLGRVGTPASMQATWPVGLSVFYRNSRSEVRIPVKAASRTDVMAATVPL
ncbi:hypothetical protein [Geobacter benzoatilyticus]|uniref:Response receiver domain-containing protein n=1 Tax=Geobacter benzoatilyticus TaxID=2815309 RepID=A0ABX7Q239_9BACT|nr:hypothetical protein [Geobacter benzoatilyticus]QSV45474.1 hypothetical protein JZM60_15350 [Geobacter benzoatilyticus]